MMHQFSFLVMTAVAQSSLPCGVDRQEVSGVCICIPLSRHPDCSGVSLEQYHEELTRAMSRRDCFERGYSVNGTCECDRGWEGPNCDQPLCFNGATRNETQCVCTPSHSGFHCDGCGRGILGPDAKCACELHWSGVYCEIPLNCLNGGRMLSREDGVWCECPEGTVGNRCEDTDDSFVPPVGAVREQWEGVWTREGRAWEWSWHSTWILISVLIVLLLIGITFLFLKFDRWRSQRAVVRGYEVYMSQAAQLEQSIDEPYWDPRVNPVARVLSLPEQEKRAQTSTTYIPPRSQQPYRCPMHSGSSV